MMNTRESWIFGCILLVIVAGVLMNYGWYTAGCFLLYGAADAKQEEKRRTAAGQWERLE